MAGEAMDRKQAIDKAMKDAGGVGFLTSGEVKELPKILWTDELPLKAIRGFYGGGTGLLVGTDRRLLFIDKGLMSLKVEDFSYDKITSIQYKTGIVWGEIEVLASGNRAIFKNIEKKYVRDFGDWLRAKISAPKPSPSTIVQVAAPTPGSHLEDLVRLAELNKQGVLTDEEFAAKKKQLLGI